MVRDAVQWARNSGLSNKDAQAEAATLLGLTASRIWTLLYKPETVRKIPEGELSKIGHGYRDVLWLESATARDLSEHLFSMADALEHALEQEDAAALLLSPRHNQSQSLKKRPFGQPLWQIVGPCKRPRKARA